MRAAVETSGYVRNLGWDFDREWVLGRTAGEAGVGGACPTKARRVDTIGASKGDLDVWDCDADVVTGVNLCVDSALEAGRELTPILDADRDADSVLDAGREAEDCDLEPDPDHGRDMSRRRDGDGSFSFSFSLKESLNESKNECVRACTVDGTAADADFPVK